MIRNLNLETVAFDHHRYRVISRNAGVIGPPDRAFDRIMQTKSIDANHVVIQWQNSGQQRLFNADLTLSKVTRLTLDKRRLAEYWDKAIGSRSVIGSNKSSFILLTGLPGSGKTTFARYLSERLNALHFDFSEIAKSIFGHHPTMQIDYVRLGQAIEPLIHQYLRDGGSVIYDTTAVDEKMREHHFSCIPRSTIPFLVWIDSSIDDCRARLLADCPETAPDLRTNVNRASDQHIRTFQDFADDFVAPKNAIVVHGFSDYDAIANQLTQDETDVLDCRNSIHG